MQAFKQFVEATLFCQVKDLVSLFEQKFSYKIKYGALLRAMHRLNWTRKKKLSLRTS